jgi:nucleoside-diphosphate-sugar epimerase
MSPKRVMVTGATSLIGSVLVQQLLERGDEVVAFQRGSTRAPDTEPTTSQRPDLYAGDVRDAEAVAAAMAGCNVVVHLAAKVGVVGDRSEYADINIGGSRNVLDAARQNGTQVVHVSSPSVAHDGTPIVGGGADAPVGDHGVAWYPQTKAVAETMMLQASDDRTAVVAIRPHLVWGPGDTQLIGRIVERARSGRLALVGGGRALVDTTYVDNAASALVAAVDAIEPMHPCAGRAYVVSNGEPRPIRELVLGICAAAGVTAEPRDVPLAVARRIGSMIDSVWPRLGRDDEPPLTRFLAEQLGTAHWFDQRDVREDLDWVPTVSIDDGLRALADWYSASRTQRGAR